jgi:hypothetical protein
MSGYHILSESVYCIMFHVCLPYHFLACLQYHVPCLSTISFQSLFTVSCSMFVYHIFPLLFTILCSLIAFHNVFLTNVPDFCGQSIYQSANNKLFLVQLTMSCILPILCVVVSVCPPYLVHSYSEISYFVLHVIIIMYSLSLLGYLTIYFSVLFHFTSYHHQPL